MRTKVKVVFLSLLAALVCAAVAYFCWPRSTGVDLEAMGFRVRYDLPRSLTAFGFRTDLLKRFSRVSEVEVDDTDFNETRLKAVALFYGLRSLSIHRASLPRGWCEYLGSLTNLESLELVGVQLDRNSFEGISHFQKLKSFVCAGCRIPDRALPLLSSNRLLIDLDLANTSIGEDGLAELAHLQRLRRLTVTCKTPNSAAGAILGSMTNLIELNVAFDGGGPNVWLGLAKSPRVRSLGLSAMPLELSDLLTVSEFPALETLVITRCQLSGGDALCLTNSKHLRYLRIASSSVPRATVDRLRALLLSCDVCFEPGDSR